MEKTQSAVKLKYCCVFALQNTSRTVVRDRLIESLKNISFVGALGKWLSKVDVC